MTESGHYYTVYFTSLAVGFCNDVAFRHAVLAQMPDEVESLDAVTLQINAVGQDALGIAGSLKFPLSMLLPSSTWRYLVNFTVHSLVDSTYDSNSSHYQTKRTMELLRRYDAYSLEFGFLLHRLGDNYAHRKGGNEKELYPIDKYRGLSIFQGHGYLLSYPDYVFLPQRQPLFFEYLRDLYEILYDKATNPRYGSSNCKFYFAVLSFEKLKKVYENIFNNVNRSTTNPRWPNAPRNSGLRRITADTAEKMEEIFIQQIKDHCWLHLQEEMEPKYIPEHIKALPLSEFLKKNPNFEKMGINEADIQKAVRKLFEKLTDSPETMGRW